jgi:hypothetical protein
MTHYWSPTPPARKAKVKHSQLEAEKRQLKIHKHNIKLTQKNNRDKTKRKVSRLAKQAEKQTEKQIIHATKNSGRSNKDGDHVLYENITLDTKLQSTRMNPVVSFSELEKVRKDATRAGMVAGGLLIRNKHGVGVIVFAEEDVPRICAKDICYEEK